MITKSILIDRSMSICVFFLPRGFCIAVRPWFLLVTRELNWRWILERPHHNISEKRSIILKVTRRCVAANPDVLASLSASADAGIYGLRHVCVHMQIRFWSWRSHAESQNNYDFDPLCYTLVACMHCSSLNIAPTRLHQLMPWNWQSGQWALLPGMLVRMDSRQHK